LMEKRQPSPTSLLKPLARTSAAKAHRRCLMGKGVRVIIIRRLSATVESVLRQGGSTRRQVFKELTANLTTTEGVGSRIPIVRQTVARVHGAGEQNAVRD